MFEYIGKMAGQVVLLLPHSDAVKWGSHASIAECLVNQRQGLDGRASLLIERSDIVQRGCCETDDHVKNLDADI